MDIGKTTEKAIRETLFARVDLVIDARKIARDMVLHLSDKVRSSPYLTEAEKENLLKRLSEA